MSVCIDGGLTMFGSLSDFIAKNKKKTPNMVESHCVLTDRLWAAGLYVLP